MSPYIVTTTKPCGAQFNRCKDSEHATVTRRAVATLDEAVGACSRELLVAEKGVTYADGAMGHRANVLRANAARRASEAISESGGTVGPLSDGTTIEVEHVRWDFLNAYTPDPMGYYDEAGILAAFNEAQR
jgi:hypothetical protein